MDPHEKEYAGDIMRFWLAGMLLGASLQLGSIFPAAAQTAAQGAGQGIDVAVVSQLAGEVSYTSSSQSHGKITPYMRVREGDRVNVPAGAQVRLVFFESGRQERWVGPGSFRAGKGSAQPLSGKPAEVAVLPTSAPMRIARVPELLQNAKLGGIQVRSPPTSNTPAAQRDVAVRDARTAYEQMRKLSPANDVTPELFLYSALSEYSLYDDMRTVVQEMLRKQPENDDAKSLAGWLNTRAGK